MAALYRDPIKYLSTTSNYIDLTAYALTYTGSFLRFNNSFESPTSAAIMSIATVILWQNFIYYLRPFVSVTTTLIPSTSNTLVLYTQHISLCSLYRARPWCACFSWTPSGRCASSCSSSPSRCSAFPNPYSSSAIPTLPATMLMPTIATLVCFHISSGMRIFTRFTIHLTRV